MKAALLVKNAPAKEAFKIKNVPKPDPANHQVLIKVEGFGLNFADVSARQGIYRDCPPLPAIIGYDVVGRIEALGNDVTSFSVGDRVTALTRFGGYAEYALTDSRACAKIPDTLNIAEATALTTQYCTAYYCFEEMVRLYPKNKVLVHAAAGGVGTALVQLAKHRGCTIFATASGWKHDYLKEQGVDYAIDYTKDDFEKKIKHIVGDEGLDVVFDPVGGESVKKGFRVLGAGGRIVLFGAAKMNNANAFQKIKTGLNFGFWHPFQLMMNSKSIIGVNMLRIADYRPNVLNRCLNAVVDLTQQGILKPTTGKIFSIDELAEAHEFLEQRKSIGKVAVHW